MNATRSNAMRSTALSPMLTTSGLKEKLASAEKTVSIWKQRYEAVSEKYMELKQKAQPFLDALEIASERVRAFINSILIRGKETQEHKHPARKRGQDMEL